MEEICQLNRVIPETCRKPCDEDADNEPHQRKYRLPFLDRRSRCRVFPFHSSCNQLKPQCLISVFDVLCGKLMRFYDPIYLLPTTSHDIRSQCFLQKNGKGLHRAPGHEQLQTSQPYTRSSDFSRSQ